MTTQLLDDLICAVLRDECPPWPGSDRPVDADAFLRQAQFHGVVPLLNECLGSAPGWPSAIKDAVHRHSLSHAMWELRHQQVLSRLIATLTKAGITPLVFKGSALAYSLYANPVWRTRSDTDILVASNNLSECRATFDALGFTRLAALPGDQVSNEESWVFVGSEGSTHVIDLHHKISNSKLLARLFPYDSLRKTASPLPALCTGALAPSRVDAMLIACMHRAVHATSPVYFEGIAQPGENRLIWLYDIHLLSASFRETDWRDFLSAARRSGLAATCLDGLDLAAARLKTSVPADIRASLMDVGADHPVDMYLRGTRAQREWLNVLAVDGMRNKVRFVWQTVLPPGAYMRQKFPEAQATWLPWLYVKRASRGVAKRLTGRLD